MSQQLFDPHFLAIVIDGARCFQKEDYQSWRIPAGSNQSNQSILSRI